MMNASFERKPTKPWGSPGPVNGFVAAVLGGAVVMSLTVFMVAAWGPSPPITSEPWTVTSTVVSTVTSTVAPTATLTVMATVRSTATVTRACNKQ
jgi:hypothetical protein